VELRSYAWRSTLTCLHPNGQLDSEYRSVISGLQDVCLGAQEPSPVAGAAEGV